MGESQLQLRTSWGTRDGHKIVHLSGPLTIATLFDFKDLVRADRSTGLFFHFYFYTSIPAAEQAIGVSGQAVQG